MTQPATPNLYIPTICSSSSTLDIAQRRLLLCGEPGVGKTFTSITTSPNPIVMDIDKGITDPRLVALAVPTFDVHSAEWCQKHVKRNNRCVSAMELLKGECLKLTGEQTLIIDSLSALQDDLERYNWDITPISKKTGEKDGFDFWELNKDWWNEFFTRLSLLKCHVIVTAHLTERKHKENPLLTVGFQPLISGGTKEFISRFFTDVIMQHATSSNPDTQGKVKTIYKWQVKSDSMFKAKSRANVDSLFIEADFSNLIKIN